MAGGEEGEEEFDDLPEFANDSNRELHRQLKANQKACALIASELAQTKERIETMNSHLASVRTETLHTQRLVNAKVKEIETEDHLKQLAERERGRYHMEYKKLQTEMVELADKINGVQAAVFKGNERMDQFKLQMNWNQEELEQWALAARQKEEDNLALLKCTILSHLTYPPPPPPHPVPDSRSLIQPPTAPIPTPSHELPPPSHQTSPKRPSSPTAPRPPAQHPSPPAPHIPPAPPPSSLECSEARKEG